jgi:DNA-nicking Smr family endonuclease
MEMRRAGNPMNSRRPAQELISPLGRRRLTSDEEQLWSLVARTVRPLRYSKKPPTDTRHKIAGRDTTRPAKNRPNVEPKVSSLRQHNTAAPALSPITRSEKQKLARGHAAVEARIDLHGMTQGEAHGALQRLLHRSQANGAKFVLVITGKGLPHASRGERGVLRRQVPLWLALPEFRRYVLGFDVAATAHGGEGALYVRLRKAKA